MYAADVKNSTLDSNLVQVNWNSIFYNISIACFAMQGVFSDLFVVRGIEIGHEIVSVHLLEPDVKHMADKIVLTVAEAMSLEPPSPVFVLVGATVRYSLKVIRANIPQGLLFNSL